MDRLHLAEASPTNPLYFPCTSADLPQRAPTACGQQERAGPEAPFQGGQEGVRELGRAAGQLLRRRGPAHIPRLHQGGDGDQPNDR